MRLLVFAVATLGLTACVTLPDVYLVDRHTVMESEASGEWPEIETRLRREVRSGPQALPAEGEDIRRQRAFRVLNGELVSPADPNPL